MKKLSFLSIVFWASFCMVFVSLAGPMTRISNAKTSGPPIFAGEVVIQGSPASVPAGYKIKKVLPHANLLVVEVQMGKESDHVQSLRGKGHKAGLNNKYKASLVEPNDPFYSYQWHLPLIQCAQAWDVSTGFGVTVAVLDSGLRTGGQDGIGYPVGGIDIVNLDNDPFDDAGHGTHVSGTIAQSTNNGIGVAGVAYDAFVMPVKVLAADGYGSTADIADGIVYAVDNGAQVINMSLGSNARARITSDPFMDDALDYAYNGGVTVVCAAGNDSWRKNVGYPAIYPTTIAVGATDYNNNKAFYSNYGTGLDLMAPGGDTRVDLNEDGYVDGVLQETFGTDGSWNYFFYQGTSMACPHVTGVVAQLLQRDPSLTPDEVRDALNNTALDLGVAGPDSTYGHGLVQANDALLSIMPAECPDADGDGYDDIACAGGTDCDDTDPAVNLGATEVCNGVDDNCDTFIDEGLTTTYYEDADEDGYGNPGNSIDACTAPTGYVTDGTDCNDSDGDVYPGAMEVCNGVDDDCDTNIDEGFSLTTYYEDADGDTYGNPDNSIDACTPPTGYITDGTDCDDSDGDVYPGAEELCNGVDDNCIDGIDEGCPTCLDTWESCTANEQCCSGRCHRKGYCLP